jgi:hypothetical protein
VKKWNYVIDATETVPYVKINYQGLPIQDTSSGYPTQIVTETMMLKSEFSLAFFCLCFRPMYNYA